MELTKYEHACVVLKDRGTTVLIDPGAFAPSARDLLRSADAVLITHDHFDHFDAEAVREVVAERPDLPIHAPASVLAQLDTGNLHETQDGQTFSAGDVPVRVFQASHAQIHADVPVPSNAAFLLDERVYHPGDSYLVPGVPVETLLVPTSGPWAKFGEGIDFVRAIAPTRSIQIHEMMLSEIGQQSAARFLGEEGPTKTPFSILPVGASDEI